MFFIYVLKWCFFCQFCFSCLLLCCCVNLQLSSTSSVPYLSFELGNCDGVVSSPSQNPPPPLNSAESLIFLSLGGFYNAYDMDWYGFWDAFLSVVAVYLCCMLDFCPELLWDLRWTSVWTTKYIVSYRIVSYRIVLLYWTNENFYLIRHRRANMHVCTKFHGNSTSSRCFILSQKCQ